ncbi:MAG: ISL3 family transposase [Acidiferrobacter thiooxydans]
MGQGKGRETIDRFFNEQLSDGQKQRIRWASCDMSRAYTGAIQHHCPNATLVIDRFHVVKALNEALDAVRKDEWRGLDKRGRQAIKGLAWDARDAGTPSFQETVALLKRAAHLQPAHPSRLGAEG